MKTISETYAEFITRTRFEDLGPEVVQQTKKLLLDLVGVSLAGYATMEFPKIVVGFFSDMGGKPEATILQTKKKFPAVNAAFANASCAHALDMDDGHRFGALHPGVAIVPAALAAAERVGADSKTFLAGMVTGYEVMIRLGAAITPSSLNRGFHITGITGVYGAAAACANIMKLNPEETAGALGMAGLQASGLIQVNHEVEGAKVKPLNPARAASNGLLSCVLAQGGARGPLQIFEGEDGYLKAVSDEIKQEVLIEGLGKDFEILKVYVKLYAACRHAHAPIDAVFEALKGQTVGIDDIARVTVETYSAAVRLAGIREATTPSAARFSIPFSVALAIARKEAGPNQYCDETVGDRRLQALAQKVEMSVGEKWEKAYPRQRGATVTLHRRSGTALSFEVGLAKGEPENPASWDEMYRKFFSNATQVLAEKEAKEVGERIMALEESSLDDVLRLL
ncbi:MAG: MmgE/PrpD family protein [Desulfobacterota bacterium]|jgi:2-methylcitrate dehydratase PrpD|nr:MmgE/PrpD family protein [Thermodesulfobacteriota bacterium]